MAEGVVIKIAGNSAEYAAELEKIKKQTEDLEGQLTTMATASGAAFAAFTATIGLSVGAFREQEQAIFKQEALLKASGYAAGVTSAELQKLASATAENSIYGDEMVASGQNILLTFKNLGGDVLPKANQAMVDMASDMGGVESAAGFLGKVLNNPIKGMQLMERSGMALTASQKEQVTAFITAGDVASAQAVILETVSKRYEGVAKAATMGTGSFLVTKNAMGEIAEEIGSHFAPALIAASEGLRSVINYVREHPQILKLTSAVLAAGAVVTGLGTALSVGALMFLKFRAAMIAAQVATSAMTIATRALVGATGIGLLVIVLTEVALNWSTLWPKMQGVFNAFAKNIIAVGNGITEVLKGMLSFDVEKIKAGAGAAATAMAQGWNESMKAVKFTTPDPAEDKKAPKPPPKGDIQGLLGDQIAKNQQEILENQRKQQIILDQEAGFTAEYIDLKKKGWEIEDQLRSEQDLAQREKLAAAWQANLDQQVELEMVESERQALIKQEFLAGNEEFQAMTKAQQDAFVAANMADMQKGIADKKSVREAAVKEEWDALQKKNKQFLDDQRKYGTAYALINKMMYSEVMQGTSKAFGELAPLIQSENAKLKSIGKVAAVADIMIKSAQSAMNVYAGFSTIPIIGPALGIAGAAAAIAFGVEQSHKVTRAARGGVLTGGRPGQDSIPVMAMPGETIVPTKNYDETVNAVADARNREANRSSVAASGGSQQVYVMIEMSKDASRFITAKQVEDRALGLSRE